MFDVSYKTSSKELREKSKRSQSLAIQEKNVS